MLYKLVIKLFLLFLICAETDVFPQGTPYAKYVVNTLASAKYMGRGYTGKADLRAARFIAGEYKSAGLEPAGEYYFQPFYINVNTFPGQMEVKLNGNLLVPGVNYLVSPSSASLRGKFKIIRLSRKDLADSSALEECRKVSAGQAILVDLTDTLDCTPVEEKRINQAITSISYGSDFKNRLTIVLSDKKLTWGIAGWQSGKAVISMNPGGIDTRGLTEAEVSIKAVLKENYQTRNVCGMIRGTVSPDTFLVVTAHYDHLGRMGKETIFTGANDNASGVAMLLSLCRYYAANPPAYSILFIAFSAEEAGLLGSKYFTANPAVDLNKIKFLVNFDMAGTGDKGIKVVNGTIFKSRFEKLRELNDFFRLLPAVESRGEACISDHCYFYRKNVPCFYIYTQGGISAYHDIYDRSSTLPFTEFKDYVELMTLFLDSF